MYITNQANIPISVAVYLATSNYNAPSYAISATQLLKPLKQIVLGMQVPEHLRSVDVLDLVKSTMGNSIHDGIEAAWKNNYEKALHTLGYSKDIIDRVYLNPENEELARAQNDPNSIIVHTERRKERELDGYTISGEYDFSLNGQIEDFKSTSTFVYTKQRKVDDFMLQGSIYRWIHQDVLTCDTIQINYIFTDWKQGLLGKQQDYPPTPILAQRIPLLSLDNTETFIRNKIAQVEQYKNKPENELPTCTDEELWMSESEWKYYADPTKTARSTKNFGNQAEAETYRASKGKGVVIEKKGEAKACNYCPAAPICNQRLQLIEAGLLKPF